MNSILNLIGVSAQSPIERIKATEYISKALSFDIANYDTPILETLKYVTGLDKSVADESEVYLGREWSYVRDEKFIDDKGVVFKPVRYYLSPKQIITKLRYNMRDIHPDFWVNAFYQNNFHIPKIGSSGTVVPVKYPNEADGVIDHNGLIIRINNPHHRGVFVKDNLLMDNYPCNYIVDIDGNGLESALDETLCTIKNLYKLEATTK